jgi:hypothetical protein
MPWWPTGQWPQEILASIGSFSCAWLSEGLLGRVGLAVNVESRSRRISRHLLPRLESVLWVRHKSIRWSGCSVNLRPMSTPNWRGSCCFAASACPFQRTFRSSLRATWRTWEPSISTPYSWSVLPRCSEATALAFTMGRIFGTRILASRFGHRYFNPKRQRRVRAYFRTYGSKVVFIARFLPGLRFSIFLSAGMLHVRPYVFIVYDRWPRCSRSRFWSTWPTTSATRSTSSSNGPGARNTASWAW